MRDCGVVNKVLDPIAPENRRNFYAIENEWKTFDLIQQFKIRKNKFVFDYKSEKFSSFIPKYEYEYLEKHNFT